MSDIHDDGVLKRIQDNDPLLTYVRLHAERIPDNFDLRQAGRAIAENSHLEKIHMNNCDFRDDTIALDRFEPLINGIVQSKSVRELYFCRCVLTGPLLKLFSVEGFNSMNICEGCTITDETITALKCVKMLEEIGVEAICIYQSISTELAFFQQLSQMNPRKLEFNNVASFSEQTCNTINRFLLGPNTRIKELELCDSSSKNLILLSNGLIECKTLDEIHIDIQGIISNQCWKALFSVFVQAKPTLRVLDLISSPLIRDGQVVAHGRMSEIALMGITSSVIGLKNTGLKVLNLSFCSTVTDAVISSLSGALMTNSTLEELNLENCPSVTPTAWLSLSDVFCNPNTSLQTLNLGNNAINDIVVTSFAEKLRSNSTMECLDISPSSLPISHDAWREMARLLSHPGCSLETLYIGHPHINFGAAPDGMAIDDEALAILVNGLTRNSRLRLLGIHNDSITPDGWSLVSNLLCNTASIQTTLNSNHTLEEIWLYSGERPPHELDALLKMNENEDKLEVAHSKVVVNHSARSFELLSVEMGDFEQQKLLPSTMAWLCRDKTGQSHVYEIIRSMPHVFEKHQEGTTKLLGWSNLYSYAAVGLGICVLMQWFNLV